MRSGASQGGIHESSHAAGKMKNDSTCCLEGLDGTQHGADQEKCHLLSAVYYNNELVCMPATDKALHIHSAGKHFGRQRMQRYQFCSIVVTKRLQTTGLKAKKCHTFSHKMNRRGGKQELYLPSALACSSSFAARIYRIYKSGGDGKLSDTGSEITDSPASFRADVGSRVSRNSENAKDHEIRLSVEIT